MRGYLFIAVMGWVAVGAALGGARHGIIVEDGVGYGKNNDVCPRFLCPVSSRFLPVFHDPVPERLVSLSTN